MRGSIAASPNGGSFPIQTTLELQGSFTLDKVPADPTTITLILTPPNSSIRIHSRLPNRRPRHHPRRHRLLCFCVHTDRGGPVAGNVAGRGRSHGDARLLVQYFG